MRGTAGDIEVGLQNLFHSAARFRILRIEAAGNRACAACNHKRRLRHGFVCFLERKKHVPAHGSRHQHAVGVTRRRNHLDAETPHIPCERVQNIEIEFACGASARRNLADFQGTAAELRNLAVRLKLILVTRILRPDQRLAAECGQVMLLRKRNRFRRARLRARGTEQAFACPGQPNLRNA